jgi:hypothetical protein
VSRRKALLRAGEVTLVAVVAIVLPLTISTPGVYLAAAAPCMLAGAVLAYLDGREPRR